MVTVLFATGSQRSVESCRVAGDVDGGDVLLLKREADGILRTDSLESHTSQKGNNRERKAK